MRLTKAYIDALRYERTPPAQDIRWDSDIRGFGVRVYESGKKSFVISYRQHGRKHIMVLGPYGVLTVQQARELAQAKLASVISGADPIEDQRAEMRRGTVSQLCDAYVERHASRKKSSRDDIRRIEKVLRPAWGNLKLTALKRADVAELHHKLRHTPYEANRVLSLVSKLFSMADAWGFVPEGSPNPAAHIERYPEEKRDRFLSEQEFRTLVTVISAEPPFIAAAVWLYLLTGLRKTELLKLKWTDVDLAKGELAVRDNKADRPHYLPLSSAAAKILGALPMLDGNPHVFPGRRKGRHIVNFSKPWERIRSAAQIDDVRIHDLRRTVGSYMAQSGVTLNLIARVLNHSNLETTQIYARFQQDNVRQTLERHGERLSSLAAIAASAEVER